MFSITNLYKLNYFYTFDFPNYISFFPNLCCFQFFWSSHAVIVIYKAPLICHWSCWKAAALDSMEQPSYEVFQVKMFSQFLAVFIIRHQVSKCRSFGTKTVSSNWQYNILLFRKIIQSKTGFLRWNFTLDNCFSASCCLCLFLKSHCAKNFNLR